MIDVKKAFIDIGFPIELVPVLEYINERYQTDAVTQDGKYIGLGIYEVSKSGRVAYIKDLFCIKDTVRCINEMGRRIKERFPEVQFVKFHKRLKNRNGGTMTFRIERFTR